ncbi:MAG: type II toxin-antitoxin system ParD family antitoxin [Candidatus Hydrogenedentales bacterium]
MVSENIKLPEHQAEFVRRVIATGRFQSVSEVVRAGVSLLEERLSEERKKEEQLQALLDAAKAGGIEERTPQEIWAAVKASYNTDDQ